MLRMGLLTWDCVLYEFVNGRNLDNLEDWASADVENIGTCWVYLQELR